MNPHQHTPARYISRYVARPDNGYSTFTWFCQVWTAADNGHRIRLDAEVELNPNENEEEQITRELKMAAAMIHRTPPDLGEEGKIAARRCLMALAWLVWDRGLTDSPQPKPAP